MSTVNEILEKLRERTRQQAEPWRPAPADDPDEDTEPYQISASPMNEKAAELLKRLKEKTSIARDAAPLQAAPRISPQEIIRRIKERERNRTENEQPVEVAEPQQPPKVIKDFVLDDS